MFRVCQVARCAATAAAAAASPAAAAAKAPHSYEARLASLKADPASVLAGGEYQFLQRNLAVYQKMQNEYAVKQNDIERAKKAGQVCGLEMTKRKERVSTDGLEDSKRHERNPKFKEAADVKKPE